MSDGQAFFWLIVMVVIFVGGLIIAAVHTPEKFAEGMRQAAHKAQESWAAQQEAKRKKREETGNAIASILANIMKKRS